MTNCGSQQTINREALEAYSPDAFDLIPLHKPDATRTKKGVTRKMGKAPLHASWTTRRYNSRAVIASCIDANRNVGVRLRPDQLVIDVDPRNGGEEGFTNLCLDIGLDDSMFPRVITGSGGSHYYMTKPADEPVLDTLKDYPGVEFKSRGRQVVAAGSIHPDTLRFYKWDDEAPALEDIPAAPAKLIRFIKRPQRAVITGGGQYSQEQIATMLAGLDPAAFAEHSEWLKLMMACHHASDGDARSEFVEWSIGDPQYSDDAEMIGRRWDSLHREKNDGVTYKSLHHALREHNAGPLIPAGDATKDFGAYGGDDDEWLEGGDAGELVPVEDRGFKLNRFHTAPDTFENAVIAVRRSPLQPAWNELKQTVDFRADVLPWPEHYGRTLNDHVGRMIRLYLHNQHQGVAYQPGKDHLHEALMTAAYGAKFNPVLEYLDGLQWDGTSRVNSLFSRFFKCADDAYTRAVSRCFMIGAVRRMRRPGSKFDTMPVLRSPQGWGKSSAVRILFGADWYSDADLGNLRDKDSAMKLRGIWVQEFAEIESLTRAETGMLKAFCSRATDRQRDPYGRIVEDAPRRCVFIATVNEGGYLKDSTGARRFWPLEIRERLDLEAIAADRDQVWAEAARFEAAGESDVLPTGLWTVAAERQADQTSDDPWADLLASFLEWRATRRGSDDETDDAEPAVPLPANRVHTCELFEHLGIRPSDMTRDKAQRLRVVMESVLGWRHQRSVRVLGRIGKGYCRAM
jgi:hypothetical protein